MDIFENGWRKNLEFPLFNLETFRPNLRTRILFASDILSHRFQYMWLINKALRQSGHLYVDVYLRDAEEVTPLTINKPGMAVEYLMGDAFSIDQYYSIKEFNIIGYNSPRDGLSCIVSDLDFADMLIAHWDRRFCGLLKSAGIGFGQEGKDYANSLLLQASTTFINDRARMLELISCNV